MDLKLLEEDDDDDGNCDLVEFYNNIIPLLRNVPLANIPEKIFDHMAVVLHGTISDCEWQELVEGMGVKDNFTITRIKVRSKYEQKPPIYIALETALQHNQNFGNILDFLLQKKRLDVLRHIRPFIEDLSNSTCSTGVKRVLTDSEQESFVNCDVQDSIISNENSSFSSEDSVKFFCHKVELNGERENVSSEKQQSANMPERHSATCAPTTNRNALSIAIQKPHTTSLVPSVSPVNSVLSVFIPHAELDARTAQKLSNMLQREQITARTLSEMDYLLVMDSNRVLKAILQEVDFIVPVVSERFLEEVRAHDSAQYLESSFAVNNCHLYQMIQNEHRTNRCLNMRVRPMIVPEMDRDLLTFDVLFSCSFRLWEEVPKLVNILKKTKQLIRNR